MTVSAVGAAGTVIPDLPLGGGWWRMLFQGDPVWANEVLDCYCYGYETGGVELVILDAIGRAMNDAGDAMLAVVRDENRGARS